MATGAGAEHERFGDGIAGKAVGAIGPSDRLAAGEKPRDPTLERVVHANPAHVIMRDRRYLDRLAREINAVGGKPVDHRPERAPHLLRWHMLETEIGAARRTAAAGLDLLRDRESRQIARQHITAVAARIARRIVGFELAH